MQFFVEHYNKKKSENILDLKQFHLEKKGGVALFGDDLLHTAVQKYDDLFLKPGMCLIFSFRSCLVPCLFIGNGARCLHFSSAQASRSVSISLFLFVFV